MSTSKTGLKGWRRDSQNGNLIVVFHDRPPLNVKFPSEDSLYLTQGMTYEEVLEIVSPEYIQNKKENELIEEFNNMVEGFVDKILSDNRFELKDGKLYRKGIPLSIPYHLAEAIVNAEDKDSLHNFWMWTSLIRKPESRESFYDYCKANNLIITKEGFVVAFRRAWKKGENSKLKNWVNLQYERLRKSKKSTSVLVYKHEGEYGFKDEVDGESCECLGNLRDLHNKSGEAVWYESDHKNYNGKSTIYQLGFETRLGESEVDFSRKECSQGLHLSSGGYDFSGYGDTALAVVFNPMDTVFSPYNDRSKMRVMALTPLCELPNDCEFTMTEEYQEIISDLMVDHLERLYDNLDNFEFSEFKEHSLFKDKVEFVRTFDTIVKKFDLSTINSRYVTLD